MDIKNEIKTLSALEDYVDAELVKITNKRFARKNGSLPSLKSVC